jgi:hypothetical protein
MSTIRVGVAGILVCAAVAAAAGFVWAQPRAEMQRVPQFDNARAVAWRSVIPAGTESTLHRHDRQRVIVAIAGGDLKTITASGETTVNHYQTGNAYFQEPMPAGVTHKDVNDTSKTIELIVVEFK